jgi:hypothetical protein
VDQKAALALDESAHDASVHRRLGRVHVGKGLRLGRPSYLCAE